MSENRIRLVTRGDDSGMCHTANVAVRDAFRKGILRNTSLMVPCPALEEAAQMFAELPGLCVGLHAALNSEWDAPRWGPVLAADEVPSLVDENGHLFQTTQALHDNDPVPEEMMAEIQAQLDLARREGLEIAYVDCHMGFSWIDEMEERVADFARREGLIYRPAGLSRLPEIEGEYESPAEGLMARLEAAEPATYLLVGHPGYDNDEMQALGHPGHRDVAAARDRQRRMFMEPPIVEYCESHGVEPIRFTEL